MTDQTSAKTLDTAFTFRRLRNTIQLAVIMVWTHLDTLLLSKTQSRSLSPSFVHSLSMIFYFRVFLSFYFFWARVAAFTFTFNPPSECDDLGLTWTGKRMFGVGFISRVHVPFFSFCRRDATFPICCHSGKNFFRWIKRSSNQGVGFW